MVRYEVLEISLLLKAASLHLPSPDAVKGSWEKYLDFFFFFFPKPPWWWKCHLCSANWSFSVYLESGARKLWWWLQQSSGRGRVSQSSPSLEIFSPIKWFSGSRWFQPQERSHAGGMTALRREASRAFLDILNITESLGRPWPWGCSGLVYTSGGPPWRCPSCCLLGQQLSRTTVQRQGPGSVMINDVPVLIPTRCIIFWPLSRYLGAVLLHHCRKQLARCNPDSLLADGAGGREGRNTIHGLFPEPICMAPSKPSLAESTVGNNHPGEEPLFVICLKYSSTSLTFCVILHKMAIWRWL